MCVLVSPACMSVQYVHAVPLEAKKGCGSGTGVAEGCELGTEPWSFGRADSVLRTESSL